MIGKKIKEIRKQSSLTQQEFADLFGVSYQAVSKWENDKTLPTTKNIRDICKYFKLDINEFMGNSKKTNSYLIYFLIGIFLLTTICIVSIMLVRKDNKYSVSTLKSLDRDFTVSGNVIHNENNTTISINNIQYNKDNTKYDSIKAILYEEYLNIKKEIATKNTENNITIREYLNNKTFTKDYYDRVCRDYIKLKLYIELHLFKDNKMTINRINIKLAEKIC